ncbi:uncharacterized protein LOC111989409 [Quercus suber]|uniref:uncharacterized protein LOC111989409 n=1 Tax=Quercus suber TaxID=58331 RepID=UPI0032E056CF
MIRDMYDYNQVWKRYIGNTYEKFYISLLVKVNNTSIFSKIADEFHHLFLCVQYESCGMYIMKIMEPILQLYVDGANLQCDADNIQLSLAEVKLPWIVHIFAAVLKTLQISGHNGELQEVFDTELSARVWQLINVTDSGWVTQSEMADGRLCWKTPLSLNNRHYRLLQALFRR